MSIVYDEDTQRWFYQNPFSQTTVVRCEDCGLYYKPILGHRCKKEGKEVVRNVRRKKTR